MGVDIQNPKKYKMVMLFSGGIGVTPMQSLCNQLMYEHQSNRRSLKQLSFVWIERDPQVFHEVDVVRDSARALAEEEPPETERTRRLALTRSQMMAKMLSSGKNIGRSLRSLFRLSVESDRDLGRHVPAQLDVLEEVSEESLCSEPSDEELAVEPPEPETDRRRRLARTRSQMMMKMASSGKNIGSSLLSLFPASVESDRNLGRRFPRLEVLEEVSEDDLCSEESDEDVEAPQSLPETIDPAEPGLANTDFTRSRSKTINTTGFPLDLQVYLTAKDPPPDMPPFVHYGRPDIKQIFRKIRTQAVQVGEKQVAVCVCAPVRIVDLCRQACAKYSDCKVSFDFHSEVFE